MATEITPKELAEKLKAQPNLRLIDVREPHEFRACHIPNAENIPLGTIHGALPGIDPEEPLVMICRVGGRSSMACQRIQSGHRNLYNLAGGTDAWIAAGLPGVGDPKAQWGPERQSFLLGGSLALLGAYLALTGRPAGAILAALPGIGLTMLSLTGFCPMVALLKLLPYNRSRRCNG